MTAAHVAKELKDRGVPVVAVHEGSEAEDGEVVVCDWATVQVPWPSGRPFLMIANQYDVLEAGGVVTTDEEFDFLEPAADFDELAKQALEAAEDK